MASPDSAQTPRVRSSLRLRLTLWVIVIFAIMQIAFSAVFVAYQRASIHEYFDVRFAEATDALALELRARVPDLTDGDLQILEQRETQSAPFEQFLLTVYDQTGGVIASTQRPVVPADQIALSSVFAQSETVKQRMPMSILGDHDSDAMTARTVLRRFNASDGRDYALFTATSDAYAQQMLSVVYNVLLVAAPIGLLAAAVSGWLIAGIAVRPLQDVRRIVMGITPESIGKRLPASARDFEIARLESELDAARKRIEQGFQAQARFMSNVSHELKTPISILITESETLDVAEIPADVRAFVLSVREEMRRLATLIDSFLTLTRVRDGQRATVSQRCSVNDLVMDSVEHCAPMASQYAVTLAPQLIDGKGMDATVAGDPHLLTTMIDNLVRNSIRFTPEGGSVEIRAAANGANAMISVRDYGVGIPESLIDRVFDRFAQAEAEERMGRGHGLGLEIAQGIAELHNGVIAARNCEDAGCIFTIELPLLDSDRD